MVSTEVSFQSSVSYDFTVSNSEVLPVSSVPIPPQITLAPVRSPTNNPTQLPTPARPTSPAPTRTQATVVVVFYFDQRPAETSWRLFDSDGNVVASAARGIYRDMTMAVEEIKLDEGFEYSLVVKDSAGDGICCGNGNGHFFLFMGNSIYSTSLLLYNDGQFEDVSRQRFTVSVDSIMAPDEVAKIPSLPVMPSPAPTLSASAEKSNLKGNKNGKMIP